MTTARDQLAALHSALQSLLPGYCEKWCPPPLCAPGEIHNVYCAKAQAALARGLPEDSARAPTLPAASEKFSERPFAEAAAIWVRGRPALPAPEPPPITTAMLAAALDDVFETTQWEGKGASIAPGLYAALKSRLGAALPAEREFKINHWANVQASGGLPAEHAPPDAKQKLTEILAQWQMADPSKLTADQWAILGGCAGYLMSHGVTVGARPALAGRGEQKISEPTEDELVSLGECAVRGYLDFPAAKSWFSNWLAGRAAQEGQKS